MLVPPDEVLFLVVSALCAQGSAPEIAALGESLARTAAEHDLLPLRYDALGASLLAAAWTAFRCYYACRALPPLSNRRSSGSLPNPPLFHSFPQVAGTR